MRRTARVKIAAAALGAATLAAACVQPSSTTGDGTNGGGINIVYCEEDARGGLDESRCSESPTGGRTGGRDDTPGRSGGARSDSGGDRPDVDDD
jgi:hypothetical protein